MNSFEKFTPEQLKNTESRVLSDAKLIMGGAKYVQGENEKEPRMEVSEDQLENIGLSLEKATELVAQKRREMGKKPMKDGKVEFEVKDFPHECEVKINNEKIVEASIRGDKGSEDSRYYKNWNNIWAEEKKEIIEYLAGLE